MYITCEKSEGLHLAEPSLTACRLAGRLAGSLADKILARFKILKACLFDFPLCLVKVLHCFSNFDVLIMLYPGKHFYKVVLESVKFCKAL